MITIFTVPKRFNGHIGLIQRNAILSWKKLSPECEIILLGDDQGVAEVADEFGLIHIRQIKKNKYGTPLISDIFEKAQKRAKNKILAYVNADIILMDDFLKAVSRVNFDKFLIVGRRYDLDVKEEIDYENKNWQEELKKRIEKEGSLHGYAGIDYFIFPKGLWQFIPSFAIGRTAWDNWFLYKAWKKNYPLIDATASIAIVHQNHDYSHHKKGKAGIWKGVEAKENLKLAGGYANLLTIRDANFILTNSRIKKPKLTAYRIFSWPFRYFIKAPLFIKLFLWPGWLAMLLYRKIRISLLNLKIK